MKICRVGVLLREPVGVCGLITPWNWPVNQIALKVIPALATGCTCILKPSELTPLSALLYAEMIHEAGFPAGSFNLINGDGENVGSALSKHKHVDMMSFTGSTHAGIAVSKDAADSVKRVTLELGGKSPNIVFEDADLENRVTQSVQECFFNSGQSCDAPSRIPPSINVCTRSNCVWLTKGPRWSPRSVGSPTLTSRPALFAISKTSL